MGVFHVVASLLILAMNCEMIGWAFGQVLLGAFTGPGVVGGLTGALIQGVRRAAFSNEAGIGPAAIAPSAVRTREPVTEGCVALLEPFIDTVVICTMTAPVMVITGVLNVDPETGLYVWNAEAGRIATEGDVAGVQLTSAAFAQAFSWFPLLLAAAAALFAVSTMISWSCCGLKAWTCLFGEGATKEIVFKANVCRFIVIGEPGPGDRCLRRHAVLDGGGERDRALPAPMPIVKRALHSHAPCLRSGEIKRFKG